MSGQLLYISKQDLQKPIFLSLAKTAVKQTLPTKHTHVEFVFSNGDKLFYNDTRQFGHVRFVDADAFKLVMQEQGLGPEPLEISAKEFSDLIKTHANKKAKDFLLNQQVIAGIGNIYADESLFASGVRPTRKVGTLKEQQIKLLHAAIQKILQRAIKLGGSSVESFLMVNGGSGKFANEHLVYAKSGKACVVCKKTLVTTKVGSRTTVYCKNCQV